MIAFPNCKINLGLRITRKRDDGFHDLETGFYPVALRDVLEIIPQVNPYDKLNFKSSGLSISGNEADNLCIRACKLLEEDFGDLPAIKMHLYKRIPMGAGLGGGSSDASFVLSMINQLFNLNIQQDLLEKYALRLGSDCPFFLRNQPCYATGRGEILEPISINLSSYQILLVHPGIHINTAWAFTQIKPFQPHVPINKIVLQPITTWKQDLINDFEEVAIKTYPLLSEMKASLYSMGAVYAAMSGSGSSFFGIFPKEIKIDTSSLKFNFDLIP